MEANQMEPQHRAQVALWAILLGQAAIHQVLQTHLQPHQESCSMPQAASKLRITVLAVSTLLIGVFCFCCAVKGSRMREITSDLKQQTLEFENVIQYKLDLNPETKAPEKVSGLCFRSLYCVRGVTIKTNNTTLVVLVTIGVCKEGQTGNFSCPLKITSDIKELRFGTKEHILWKRDGRVQ